MFTTQLTLSHIVLINRELPFLAIAVGVILLIALILWRKSSAPHPENCTESPYPHLPFLRQTGHGPAISRRELIVLSAVTLCYAVISLHRLGSSSLPHTTWQPSATPQSVILAFDGPVSFDRILVLSEEGNNNALDSGYQFGLHGVTIELSEDRSSWTTAAVLEESRYAQYISTDGFFNAAYVRITSTDAYDSISEIAFIDTFSETVLPVHVDQDDYSDGPYPADLLIDEQDAVAIDPTCYDEAYFDEVYHPRNAWEIAAGQRMYATVHPLLGTNLIALSIRLFGMNPFAWRLPGALMGIALIPAFWYLIRILTKRSFPALFGALLFSTDFMHITTSRIATLEPMSVFAILLMYIFLIRWCNTSFLDRPLNASLKELLICGIMTGIGISVKWTACYSAVGLAILYFWSMALRYWEYRKLCSLPQETIDVLNDRERSVLTRVNAFPRDVMKTILWSFLFFLLIPIVIYYLSYLPCRITGSGWSITAVTDQIRYMYNYHTSLDATHPYQSTWKQWLLDERPIWYYCKSIAGGGFHTIACFSNPVLCWSGLVSIVYTLVHAVRTRSFASIVILVGYATALAPWLLVDRCVFAYHFYPTSFFMILSLACLSDDLIRFAPKFRWIPALLAVLSIAAFLIYLPVLTGFETTLDYVHALEIIPSWYFG